MRFRSLFMLMTLLLVSTGCGDDAPPGPRIELPKDARYLAIPISSLGPGSSLQLADLAGKPVVVNFFASWCAPCVIEMPVIEAVKQEFGSEVTFVGVAVEANASNALGLIERTGVTWRLAQDADGVLYRALGAVALPTTVVLDSDGIIAKHVTGLVRREDLRKVLIDDLGVKDGDGS